MQAAEVHAAAGGDVVLFNPVDNHACVQSDGGTLDYWTLNISQGVMPIEAALQPGFSDQSHFTNYFSRFIGLTPGAYCEIFLRRAD